MCWYLVLLVSLIGPPVPRAGALVQDVVFLHETRPLLLRFHLRVDGRPFEASWREYVGKLFRHLDADGDGVLGPAELAAAPNARQLLQQFLGATVIDPAPGPDFRELDAGPADGRVTAAELKAYYGRAGVGPVQVEVGRRQGPDQPLTDRLFAALDADRDGKLSRRERQAGAASLRRLDADDDEVVSLDELVPGGRVPGFLFRKEPGTQAAVAPLPFAFTSDPAGLARRLVGRYDKDKDGKLQRAEVGLDRPAFDRLDADRDGGLDGRELAGWGGEPDLELEVHLGNAGRTEPLTALRGSGGRARPLGGSLSRQDDGSLVVRLTGAQVEVCRNAAPPARALPVRQEYLEQFRRSDGNGDGTLDAREIYQPPFTFVALLRLADRDADGKLSGGELEAALDLQEQAAAGAAVLTFADRGRSLFELLDTDRDGRLGPREMRQIHERLAGWARDGDGSVSRAEIPHQFSIGLSHGPARLAETAVPAPGYGPTPRLPAGERGPRWFRKMDRNGDGDLSRREFLGTPGQFRALDANGDGLIDPQEAQRAGRR